MAHPAAQHEDRSHISRRPAAAADRIAVVVAGSLVIGLVAAVVVLAVLPLPPRENVVTGAVLLPWPWAWLRWAVAVGLLIHLFVIETLVAPPIRHRTFWYAVSADEIDLQHGFLITTRVVIPMNRVQHLKLEHGPLADRFGVANLEIHTAAGAVPLPAIDATEADALRRRIGELAGLADDV